MSAPLRRCASLSTALRSERTCCLRCGFTRGALRRGDVGKVGREEGGRFRTRGQEVGKKEDARTGSTQRRIHALVARRLSTTSSCRSYGLHELTCKPVRVRPSLSLFLSLCLPLSVTIFHGVDVFSVSGRLPGPRVLLSLVYSTCSTLPARQDSF